jgi:hypothetical protein
MALDLKDLEVIEEPSSATLDVNDLEVIESINQPERAFRATPATISNVGGSQGIIDLLDYFIPDSLMNVIRTGDPLAVHEPTTLRSFTKPEEVQANRELMASEIGVDLRDPSELGSGFERGAAAGVRGLFDPLVYTGPVGAGVKAVSTLAARGAQSLLPTAVADRAAEAAIEFAEEKGAGGLGQTAAAITAGILSGTTTGIAQTPLVFGAKVSGRALVGIKNRIANKGDVVKGFAGIQMKAIAINALSSQEDLLDILQKSKIMAERLGVPELKIGKIAAIAANDALNKDFRTFYQIDTEFKGQVDAAVSEYNELVKKFTSEFGGATAAQARQVRKAVSSERTKIQEVQKKRARELDNRQTKIQTDLENVSQKLFEKGDSIESGRKIKMLQSAQEKVARQNQSMVYTQLLDSGKEQGIEMGPTGTAALHNKSKELAFEELFGKGNVISSRINKFFSPSVVEETSTRTLTPTQGLSGFGRPPPAPRAVKTKKYPSIGIDQVDSLKRELNAELRRKDLSPSQYRVLQELKRTFDDQLTEMDPDFAAGYKAADLAYFENIGVPFNEPGVLAISRSKFAQETSAKMLKPEVAQQFLSAAGPEGEKVLRHAVMVQLSQKLFKDGSLNPKAVEKWLGSADNKRLLSMLPGLEDELRDSAKLTNKLVDDLSLVESERKANMYHQTDSLFKALDTNIDKVVSEMLSDGSKLGSHMKTVNSLTSENRHIVRRGLQAAMIERAMKISGGNPDISILDFITGRQHREAFTRLFGKNYVKKLDALAFLGDQKNQLRTGDMQFAMAARDQELGKRTVGITPSGVTGLARRPLVGFWQKIFIGGSMIGSKQVALQRDENIMALLLNGDLLSLLEDGIEFKDGVAVVKKGAESFGASFASTVGRGNYFGVREAVDAQVDIQEKRGEQR